MKTDIRKTMGKIGELCFWMAIVTELVIVMVDKSAYTNPFEGWLFRITFMLFCVKILTTKYTKDEWIIILVAGAVTSAAYFVSERDEVVRAAVFVISCKNMDLKKVLTAVLFVTAAGSAILFALSVAGIYGAVARTADFGRGGVETRYCFGMGHPNAFSTMIFMMSTVVIYLYFMEKQEQDFSDVRQKTNMTASVMGVYAFNIICHLFTGSNTALIVMSAFTAGMAAMIWCGRLRGGSFAYIAGAAVFVAAVIFSVYGAGVGNTTPVMYKLDRILNGRFQYSYIYEMARPENWRIFASPENQEYFDQGFIRVFYWYGLVIGAAYAVANLFLIAQSYKKKDFTLLVIIAAYAVFTIMEAHLISVYLLRNYLLIFLGYYWYRREDGEGA